MKRLVCALAVVSLSMVGCSGSLCDDFADSFSTLNDKIKGCPDLSDSTVDEPTDSEIKQCEDSLDKCSDSDKKAIESFVDCVDKLDKCSPSTEDAFATSFLACALPLANVSDQCGATGASMPAKAESILKAYKAHKAQ
ncbi:hypothetical protein [Hyalangium versicolor]|uniref:hypothetical protein n=1 Tax=Hyalangium versicolor TaxID=2861190 RepID=UPI001CCC6233|nr:hypothetical protein [Hyalangium versicolor]